MARSVDEGFSTYLSLLTPSDFDTQRAQSHRNSVGAVLKSNFGMTHFFRSGSFGFGTSVKDYSDIDYFAVVPGTSLKTNSHMSLADFLRVLDGRFPRTGVKIDSPAIVLPFGSNAGEKHEIVPAYLIETKAGYRMFGIPNRAGGWMRASPEAHAAYVSYVDKKLKPLIRLIKSWKYHNGAPVRSFYIEVAITNYAATQSSIAHDFDVLLGLSFN